MIHSQLWALNMRSEGLSKLSRRSNVAVSWANSWRAEIKQAIQGVGCPVCRICDERSVKGWFWFFNESYGAGSCVNKYINFWGFCDEHTRVMAKIGPKWQKSVIYSWIIEAHLQGIDKLQESLLDLARASNFISENLRRKSVDKLVREVKPRGECLLCVGSRQMERTYVSALVDLMKDTDIQQVYEKSDGLCMQHFFLALEIIDTQHASQLIELVKKQIKGLRELRDDFKEFFRKEDYRFSNELKGKEQTAWIRAMSKLTGQKDLGETSEV